MEPATVIGGQQRMMNKTAPIDTQTAHDNDEEGLECDDVKELEQDDANSDTI
ncbi:hypothetical protein TSUD_228570 [Trifolium subterraneum]|uniref:Uncharacterized protein n=1 Tax=Trifolium subterraneum TaxID=3900 RepID=A0A2Z6MKZ8_TRISU|nr:hypothetical protein TSUD_228570 [Trifolium subterraneum]